MSGKIDFTCDICQHTYQATDYESNQCPNCDQKYDYYEDILVCLSEQQIELLRIFNNLNNDKKLLLLNKLQKEGK